MNEDALDNVATITKSFIVVSLYHYAVIRFPQAETANCK